MPGIKDQCEKDLKSSEEIRFYQTEIVAYIGVILKN